MQAYSDPSRENDPHALPDLEIFYAEQGEIEPAEDFYPDETPEPSEAGFYYWLCFPGCMPDSEATGPFATEDEALKDAREQCSN
jgi:hypothetical protein